jgi:hypothetical protein
MISHVIVARVLGLPRRDSDLLRSLGIPESMGNLHEPKSGRMASCGRLLIGLLCGAAEASRGRLPIQCRSFFVTRNIPGGNWQSMRGSYMGGTEVSTRICPRFHRSAQATGAQLPPAYLRWRKTSGIGLLIGLLAVRQKLQGADCQSATGFHPAPLRLVQIPRPQEIGVSMRQPGNPPHFTRRCLRAKARAWRR